MSLNQTGKLLRVTPYFPVADVEKSVAHYEQKLGFQCDYAVGNPLEFAICSRDGLGIMFKKVSSPELIKPNEEQGGTWEAFFWVSDVMALYAELKENYADVVYGPIIQESYRMNEFAIRDCDGHVLGFGQPLEQNENDNSNPVGSRNKFSAQNLLI
jgi:predicted lactoylglutathione lyase